MAHADNARDAVLQSQIIHPAWTPEDHAGWLDEHGYAVPDRDTLAGWMAENVKSGAVADGRSLTR